MAFNLSGEELADYLTELHSALVRKSHRLRGSDGFYDGACREDAIQEVMVEVIQHLTFGCPLPVIENFETRLETLERLTQWARRRLTTVFGTTRRAAARDACWERTHEDDVRDAICATPPPIEHPLYDRKFLLDFLATITRDPIAHRFSILMIASQLLPWVKDVDPCQNNRIATLLGCTPKDVRNARYRIATVKNRLLADRNRTDNETDDDPEDPVR